MAIIDWKPTAKAPDVPRYRVRVYNPQTKGYEGDIHTSRAAAKKQHAELTVDIATRKVASPKVRRQTIKTYMDELLATKKLAYNTELGYTATLRNHIYPEMGDLTVADLENKKRFLEIFLNTVEADHGRAARARCDELLRMMINEAIEEDGILKADPLRRVPFTDRTQPVREEYVPSMYQVVTKLLPEVRAAVGVTVEQMVMNLAVLCLLIGAGLRIGEAMALGLDDLDPVERKIHIRRQVLYAPGKGQYFKLPKKGANGPSIRSIPLPLFAYAALRRTIEVNGTREVTLSWDKPQAKETRTIQSIFFHAELGGTMRPQSVQNRYAEYGKRFEWAGDFHPHCLRKRYTSVLGQAQVPNIVKDELTGHLPKGTLTETLYTKAHAEGREQARDAIQAAWESAKAGVDDGAGRTFSDDDPELQKAIAEDRPIGSRTFSDDDLPDLEAAV